LKIDLLQNRQCKITYQPVFSKIWRYALYQSQNPSAALRYGTVTAFGGFLWNVAAKAIEDNMEFLKHT